MQRGHTRCRKLFDCRQQGSLTDMHSVMQAAQLEGSARAAAALNVHMQLWCCCCGMSSPGRLPVAW